MSNILDELSWRGLIHDSTNLEDLKQHLSEKRLVYAGFDPTATSLHVGNLLLIITLKRFEKFGHKIVILLGGATGLIGDPSGRTSERSLRSIHEVQADTEAIKKQLSRFFEFNNRTRSMLVNNIEWLRSLSMLDFLREVGKHFSISSMLNREAVKLRLAREGEGMSYTEFSYVLLQAYDFYYLFTNFEVTVQIGGSDQWGNITAGIDLIRRKTGKTAFGLTVPLLLKPDGTKFGKTTDGAIWLDRTKTSPYAFYQFWINTPDADVIKLLKFFTFLSRDEIRELEIEVKERPERRQAQRVLAREVTKIVHGDDDCSDAERVSELLFHSKYSDLTLNDFETITHDAPTTRVSLMHEQSVSLIDLLVKTGLASSKSNARELVNSGAIRLNGVQVTDTQRTVSKKDGYFERYLIISRGSRHKHFVVFDPPS